MKNKRSSVESWAEAAGAAVTEHSGVILQVELGMARENVVHCVVGQHERLVLVHELRREPHRGVLQLRVFLLLLVLLVLIGIAVRRQAPLRGLAAHAPLCAGHRGADRCGLLAGVLQVLDQPIGGHGEPRADAVGVPVHVRRDLPHLICPAEPQQREGAPGCLKSRSRSRPQLRCAEGNVHSHNQLPSPPPLPLSPSIKSRRE